jgi:hypothetical protein
MTSGWPACGSISHMTELTEVSGAFGYGDSILAGERVRLRGNRCCTTDAGTTRC